jgi:hypothetical protein
MYNFFNNLPQDLILKIFDELDLQSKIYLLSSCKKIFKYRKDITLKKVKILINDTENEYDNIADIIDNFTDLLKNFKGDKNEFYFSKKISLLNSPFILKFTKDDLNDCTCIWENVECIIPKYECCQFIYASKSRFKSWYDYRLVKHNNTDRDISIPLILFYIGFKVILNIHGNNNIKFHDICNDRGKINVNNISNWMKRMLIFLDYKITINNFNNEIIII